jgi:predicted ATPase
MSLTHRRPVLIVLEDAHWSDPTTLEMVSRAVDRIVNLRVLLIVTFRSEFKPPWIGQPHVTTLTINRLTRRETDAMIDRVAGNKLIPAAIRQDIIDRTDGIRLFVEEITKAVLEAKSQSAAELPEGESPVSTDRKATVALASALPVPESLHASLMARLDRLGPAKEIAYHALKDARAIGQAATLLYVLNFIPLTHFHCRNYAAANAQLEEGAALAEEKGAFLSKMQRMLIR